STETACSLKKGFDIAREADDPVVELGEKSSLLLSECVEIVPENFDFRNSLRKIFVAKALHLAGTGLDLSETLPEIVDVLLVDTEQSIDCLITVGKLLRKRRKLRVFGIDIRVYRGELALEAGDL